MMLIIVTVIEIRFNFIKKFFQNNEEELYKKIKKKKDEDINF